HRVLIFVCRGPGMHTREVSGKLGLLKRTLEHASCGTAISRQGFRVIVTSLLWLSQQGLSAQNVRSIESSNRGEPTGKCLRDCSVFAIKAGAGSSASLMYLSHEVGHCRSKHAQCSVRTLCREQ